MTFRRPRLLLVALSLTWMVLALGRSGGTAASPGLYVALGDSLAAGIGSSLPRERGYPALVQRWLAQHAAAPVPYTILAVPGETAASFAATGQLDRFRDTAAQARDAGLPLAAVSLSLGGNELLALRAAGVSDRQQGLDAFRASYSAALAAVRAAAGPDTRIVVTTYYDLTEGDPALPRTDAWWIARFNEVIRAAAEAEGTTVADLHPPFQSRVTELTHYPLDVHPSNAGHVVIAGLVWAALGLDTTGPSIQISSPAEATRPTPTLQFTVADDTEGTTVTVEVDGLTAVEPLEVTDGAWVALLDLAGVTTGAIAVTVIARDVAGNVTRESVDLAVRLSSRDGP